MPPRLLHMFGKLEVDKSGTLHLQYRCQNQLKPGSAYYTVNPEFVTCLKCLRAHIPKKRKEPQMGKPLMKKKIDWTPVADKTVKEIFGKTCLVGELSKKTWAVIKAHNLIAANE